MQGIALLLRGELALGLERHKLVGSACQLNQDSCLLPSRNMAQALQNRLSLWLALPCSQPSQQLLQGAQTDTSVRHCAAQVYSAVVGCDAAGSSVPISHSCRHVGVTSVMLVSLLTCDGRTWKGYMVFGKLCGASPAQVHRRCGRSHMPALVCHYRTCNHSMALPSCNVQVWARRLGPGEGCCLGGVEVREGGIWEGGRGALEAADEGQQGLPI